MRRLKILVWNVKPSYLYYLAQCPHEFYLPYKSSRQGDYAGKGTPMEWPRNVAEVPAEKVHDLKLDAVIFQSPEQYMNEQYEILSEEQQMLPKIYLEHQLPSENVADAPHLINDPNSLLVHTTAFNDLMWDSGQTPTQVVDHGVLIRQGIQYSGDLARGIVVMNDLGAGNRRLGLDLYHKIRQRVPVDLIGKGSEGIPGGLGEISHAELPGFIAHYRFFLNPARYASLGLAVCEAMMVGMPVIGIATAEMAAVVRNGVSGYLDTNINKLIERMGELIKDPSHAHRLSRGAYRYARQRFNIKRFVKRWDEILDSISAPMAESMMSGSLLRVG